MTPISKVTVMHTYINSILQKNPVVPLFKAFLLLSAVSIGKVTAQENTNMPLDKAKEKKKRKSASGFDLDADTTVLDVNYSEEGYRYRWQLVAGITAGSIAAMTYDGIAIDKKKHYGISAVMGAASEFGLRQMGIQLDNRFNRIALASTMAFIPGLIKEFVDDEFSEKDLVADALGSVAGAVLSDLMQGPPVEEARYFIDVGVDHVSVGYHKEF